LAISLRAGAELCPQDAVLFLPILNNVALPLVHPGERNEQEL
jgi:hypothetical protein